MSNITKLSPKLDNTFLKIYKLLFRFRELFEDFQSSIFLFEANINTSS